MTELSFALTLPCVSQAIVELGNASLFPKLDADAYLSFAGIAPLSARVEAAVHAVVDDYARRGLGAFLDWFAQRERLREKLAELVGTQAENIALTAGTTRGISDLALCMPWKSGDTVLLYDGEFPANISPWQNVAQLFGLNLRFLPKPDPHAEDGGRLGALTVALRAGARLLSVSAVQFQTGFRMPLAEISRSCREHGTELAVDGIQACGVLPLNVDELDLDYLVTGAHKWLMGIEGAGFAYAKPERARALAPRTAGWLSHEEGTRFLMAGPGELRYDRPIKSSLQFMEGGSSSTVGFAALEAAVDPIRELSPAAIFAHVSAYLDALDAGLVDRGIASLRAKSPERRSGILSFSPPAAIPASAVAAGLRRRRILVSTPDGLVRFAPHFPNALSEVPLVLAALDETLVELTR